MCRSHKTRERQSTVEKTKEEETVIEDSPSRERPVEGIVDVPMKALNRAKALLSI